MAFTLYDTLYQLMTNGTQTVTFASVHTRSALNLQYRHYQVARLQVRQGGRWVTARRHRALALPAGAVAELRVKLTSTAGTRWVGLRLAVPARAAGQSGSLEVLGGDNFGGGFGGDGNAGSLDAVPPAAHRAAPQRGDRPPAMFVGRGTRSAAGVTAPRAPSWTAASLPGPRR